MMRDPGAPRRNPLFERADVESDPPPDEPVFALDDRLEDRVVGLVGPLVAAVQEAGPEAGEHLLTAAHELVLAVKVMVDAAERAIEAQRAVVRERPAPDVGAEAGRRAETPRVRRIDLA